MIDPPMHVNLAPNRVRVAGLSACCRRKAQILKSKNQRTNKSEVAHKICHWKASRSCVRRSATVRSMEKTARTHFVSCTVLRFETGRIFRNKTKFKSKHLICFTFALLDSSRFLSIPLDSIGLHWTPFDSFWFSKHTLFRSRVPALSAVFSLTLSLSLTYLSLSLVLSPFLSG